ncbi:hypothetical protein [Nitratireductor sp. XY-223]|uniref:hypothetical protein n=1 Tax=Nitratireductor sp. XY-223 TaxID=2561926 RepID=UPI0010AA8DCC|nr:hypothetical protein [Nitratireductor sp. XY-223]
MRMYIAGIGALLAAILFHTPLAAAECGACDRFETMRPAGGSAVFDDILARLGQRPAAIVTMKAGAFCDAGTGATTAAELEAATERQFVRAEQIAQKVSQCPQSCASKLNEAEYCGYSDRLVADRYRLGAIGLRISELLHIYERAGSQARHPLDVLSADMTLYGGEAMDVLRQAQEALEEGTAGAVPDVRWQASETEVNGLFGAVSLLSDFALIEGDTEQIEQALEGAAKGFRTIRDDLLTALTRAKVMEPSEQLVLEERILTAASNMAIAIAGLEASAAAARNDAAAQPSTDANAVPPGIDSAAIQETVGCLNRLTLSAMTGSEAPELATGILEECRSFDICSGRGPVYLPANMSPLRSFLVSQDEAEKQTLALLNSICSAN